LKAFAGDFNTTPVAEIKRGFVLPFARGRQVGRKLVEAAMERAREMGYRHLQLNTVPSHRTDTIDLYKKMGFYDAETFGAHPGVSIAHMEVAL
jgi:GNAT superfamily N-acetyltransferase